MVKGLVVSMFAIVMRLLNKECMSDGQGINLSEPLQLIQFRIMSRQKALADLHQMQIVHIEKLSDTQCQPES
ncbi:hypothetical protein L6164_017550 [Bauhinia variegata]|uniref:Uncharacterized protein n=1 Tax=Bauhinia variegata TaxID=167791 RepID=A0ACB9NAC4_BAUVA|nr:hypothetical protein L6164_017550 [Bauhinia variegata]